MLLEIQDDTTRYVVIYSWCILVRRALPTGVLLILNLVVIMPEVTIYNVYKSLFP